MPRNSIIFYDTDSDIILDTNLYHITCYTCCVSVTLLSIAQAPLCLSNPSIIISFICHSINQPYLWCLSLSFQMLEPRLKPEMVSLGNKVLPNRVSKNLSFAYLSNINISSCRYRDITSSLTSLDSYINAVKSLSVTVSPAIIRLNQTTPLNSHRKKTSNKMNVSLFVIEDPSGHKLNVTLINTKLKCNLPQLQYNYFMNIMKKNYVKNPLVWTWKLLRRDGDVEMNPGPMDTTLVTINCRGLKDEGKLRQLINRISTSHNIYSNLIIALQETHLEYNSLNFRWKGKHSFTASSGAKGGVITLLSDNISIVREEHLDNEAHILLLNALDNNRSTSIILANIHAPCAHSRKKADFFDKIRERIDNLLMIDGDARIIVMGDFNTTFNSGERINTEWGQPEKKSANYIKQTFEDLNLRDCWEGLPDVMTWRHGKKMSKIDRILFSDNFDMMANDIHTDWSYTDSDHGAVVMKLVQKASSNKFKKERLTRIDTRFMQNTLLKHKFLQEIQRQVNQIADSNMDPHQQLEFLKVAIRSSAIEIASNHKKEQDKLTAEIRKEINFWQSTYENTSIDTIRATAMVNLEEAKVKLDKFLDERGKYLCWRAKSKWYQEGEKSTKYFLNLEKAKNGKNEMNEIKINGIISNDPDEIDKTVEEFYKKLYEKGDCNLRNEAKIPHFLRHIKEIPEECIKMIDSEITTNDLYKTLLTCADSAPGPDGIPYSLIKLTWNYYGPLLTNSWKHALCTGSLTQSHETSYLKLLPKEGKDHTELKNWRPITLSNCDFKIVTKTLANRLTLGLADLIAPTQTAYIKDRQITDNLHLMQYVTEQISKYADSAILISLDAEKAFDSIEHWYIKAVLEKAGLKNFVSIFNLLYRNQEVSIQLNQRKAGMYNIKNGVKQGDALSCILFILGIEPLLKNIEKDSQIDKLMIDEVQIPKTLSYADDVACLTIPTINNVSKIFGHYEDMTSLSGLKLNADKTEIIQNKGQDLYEIRYNNMIYSVKPSSYIKVNGLILSFDTSQAREANVNKIFDMIFSQLRSWTRRHLSILGKIQIYKTFGLSQILFIGATIKLTTAEEKKLDHLIYKFIWTKTLDGNKAPDRIKRSILTTPIKSLGFGMIDYKEVIRSIRIKTILRLLNQRTHPLHNIIKSKTINSVLLHQPQKGIRPCLDEAIRDIKHSWLKIIKNCPASQSQLLLNIIGNEYVGNLIQKKFKNKRLGLLHRHDTLREILNMDPRHPVISKLDKSIHLFVSQLDSNMITSMKTSYNTTYSEYYPTGDKLTLTKIITSKQIREFLSVKPTIQYKISPQAHPDKIKILGRKLCKMTNIKLKSILLRSIHGDVYSGTRLKKFGMTDNDSCPRCKMPETIQHQLLECQYCKELWTEVSKITSIPSENMDSILGLHDLHDRVTLTINAEIIRRLLSIERLTADPTMIVKSVINSLFTLESGVTKYQLNLMVRSLNR